MSPCPQLTLAPIPIRSSCGPVLHRQEMLIIKFTVVDLARRNWYELRSNSGPDTLAGLCGRIHVHFLVIGVRLSPILGGVCGSR